MSFIADGAAVNETELNALTDDPPTPAVMRVMTEDVYQRYTLPNAKFEGATRLLFHEGQTVAQATIDAMFADATVSTVTPATGPAAGGTDVVIVGSNFGGVTGVTFGGTAATLVSVVSESRLTCRTPAHAAGAVTVVVTDDSGAAQKANGFTYS